MYLLLSTPPQTQENTSWFSKAIFTNRTNAKKPSGHQMSAVLGGESTLLEFHSEKYS
jgi:hypothetical protein